MTLNFWKVRKIKPHCHILCRFMAWDACVGVEPFLGGRFPQVMARAWHQGALKRRCYLGLWIVDPWGMGIQSTTHTAVGSVFFGFSNFSGENAATTQKILAILSALKKVPCFSCFFFRKATVSVRMQLKVEPRRAASFWWSWSRVELV